MSVLDTIAGHGSNGKRFFRRWHTEFEQLRKLANGRVIDRFLDPARVAYPER
jgi:hypothetical protein